MKIIFLFCFLLCFVLLSCNDDSNTEPSKNKIVKSTTKPNDLVPLDVGNKWVYRLIEYDSDGKKMSVLESAKYMSIEKYVGVVNYTLIFQADSSSGEAYYYKTVYNFPPYKNDQRYCINLSNYFLKSVDTNYTRYYKGHVFLSKNDVVIDGITYENCERFGPDEDEMNFSYVYYKRGIGIIAEVYYRNDKLSSAYELVSCVLK